MATVALADVLQGFCSWRRRSASKSPQSMERPDYHDHVGRPLKLGQLLAHTVFPYRSQVASEA